MNKGVWSQNKGVGPGKQPEVLTRTRGWGQVHPNPSTKPDTSTDPKGVPGKAWTLFLGQGHLFLPAYIGMCLPGSSSDSPKPKN